VDPARPLSTRGRGDVRLLAERAAALGAKPALIWHSGKLRAKQTAEAFWRACNPLATFAAVRGLQPLDPTNWIVEALSAESRDVMIVGHFPQLPQLLAHLVLNRRDAPPMPFPIDGMVALQDAEAEGNTGDRSEEKKGWTEIWRLP
jgi:phosphohistidine phosphatase